MVKCLTLISPLRHDPHYKKKMLSSPLYSVFQINLRMQESDAHNN